MEICCSVLLLSLPSPLQQPARTRVSVAGDDVTKVLLRLQGHTEYNDA